MPTLLPSEMLFGSAMYTEDMDGKGLGGFGTRTDATHQNTSLMLSELPMLFCFTYFQGCHGPRTGSVYPRYALPAGQGPAIGRVMLVSFSCTARLLANNIQDLAPDWAR